ncbi:MAG: uroporphyrinogen decarboxylase family protein [Oscillospiraceae bacterium]|nr:uroporphyrinogen decarboxylase family protein [Oscillospiraceae bacterium]
MNGYQRVMKALRFEPSDRVAIIPELIQHNLEVAGQTHGAYSSDPNVMVQVILEGLKAYETDAVYVSSDNYLIVEAMGGKVRLPQDDPPVLLKTAVDCIEDAVELEPLDVTKGRIPVILEATRALRKILGDEIFVKTCIDSAPFSAAAALLGPQEFMINLIDEPELCHDFLKICTESAIRYGLAAAKAGAHGLAFGDSASVLINRNMYQEFALPYAKQAIAALKEQTGLPVFYHVCGDTRHILDLMMETGADCVEIDSMVPMALAKETAAGRCAVEGNVSTIEAFYQGSAEDVIREANAIIDLFGNQGGLILSSACEIPRHTKRENVRALTDAALNYPYKGGSV